MLAVVWDEPEQEIGIARYARRSGWIITKTSPGQERRLRDWNPDGIICQLHRSTPEFVDAVSSLDCPKVELSHNIPELAIPRVRRDSHAMGKIAADHLIERGFTNLCYIGLSQDVKIEKGFYSGYMETVAGKGISSRALFLDDSAGTPGFPSGITDRIWLMDDLSPECQHWFGKHIADQPMPAGIFVWNFNYCIDLIEGCLEAGYLIPEQIAVVSTGTSEFESAFASVPVTCVIPDFTLQGYRAAVLLNWMMRGRKVEPKTIFIPPKELVVRDSSDIYAVQHVETARVIRYIMHNLDRQGLSTDDLLRETSISQWKLYNEIQQHLGCTVSEYIERERVKKAKHLIETTSLSLTRIAEKCGFSDLRQFRRAMKRVEGVTPSKFRKRIK